MDAAVTPRLILARQPQHQGPGIAAGRRPSGAADPTTVAAQVAKVKDRFAITRVVLAGDRGMLTAARLREDVGPAQLDWITALRASRVKKLVRDGALQLSLSGQVDLAEISHPGYPGERLVACKNPFLEAERARKRESLLAATEADLEKITAACARARRPVRTSSGPERSGDIQAWAKGKGIPVSDRGRIPASVVQQYAAAAR